MESSTQSNKENNEGKQTSSAERNHCARSNARATKEEGNERQRKERESSEPVSGDENTGSGARGT